MEILFQDKKIYIKHPITVQNIFEEIQNLISSTYYFSHFIINDKEIYEDPEYYLSENLYQIKKIEVIAKTAKELINDVLLTAEEYIERAMPEIQILIKEFYNTPSSKSWDKFVQLLEGIQWLNQIMTSLEELRERPSNWMCYIECYRTLQDEMKNLEEALEFKDHVLVADIIQYEIYPVFETLLIEIQKTIGTEERRNKVN
jgi:hypothetical protein